MSYQPLEKLLVRSGFSVYKLILMASKRALELADGMPSLAEFPTSHKTATIALDEILEGKVELTAIFEAREKTAKSKKKE